MHTCWASDFNRELKQPPRQRRQQLRQNTVGFKSETTALHVYHAF